MRVSMVPMKLEAANFEIIARIVKAASRKYNCDVEIDFNNGVRKAVFTGGEVMNPYIVVAVLDIFVSNAEGMYSRL